MTLSVPILQATYSSPTNSAFTHVAQFPSLRADSVEERVAHLAALRKETAVLQGRINTELTQRMEEDKAQAEAAAVPQGNRSKVDDVVEEENYGEEVVEED